MIEVTNVKSIEINDTPINDNHVSNKNILMIILY